MIEIAVLVCVCARPDVRAVPPDVGLSVAPATPTGAGSTPFERVLALLVWALVREQMNRRGAT